MAAGVIGQDSSWIVLDEEKKEQLLKISANLTDVKLRSLVEHGIGYHHAGLSSNDRAVIEEGFRKSLIMVLFCTNTLAMGVNLPAHLVIIKSTDMYSRGCLKEYPESTLLQMMGRAGRPQYDASGIAVILTQTKNIRKYERLLHGGTVPIESSLHKHIAEHLNSEIALQTISNLDTAMKWLRSTFLYVRAIKNPAHYELQTNSMENVVEKFFKKVCVIRFNELLTAGLIVKDDVGATADDVKATAFGKIMSKYYISLETMHLLQEIKYTETVLGCINLISRCKEFSSFFLRVGEKQHLNALNKDVRFPINGRIKSLEDKISCIIQAAFGNLTVTSPGLAEESLKIIRIAERLSMCLTECLSVFEKPSKCFNFGCYKALLHSVMLSRCFHAKLWEHQHSERQAKQLQTTVAAFYPTTSESDGKTAVKSIFETEANSILNKSAQQSCFPEYILEIKRVAGIINLYVHQKNRNYISNGSRVMLIVGDSVNNLLLFVDDIDNILLENGFVERTIIVERNEIEAIHAHVMHSTLVGVDVESSIVLNITSNSDEDFDEVPRRIDREKSPFAKQANINAFTDTNSVVDIRKFCYANPNVMKIQHNEEDFRSFDTNEDEQNSSSKTQREKYKIIQSKLTKYFKAKKGVKLKKQLVAMTIDAGNDVYNSKLNVNKKSMDVNPHSAIVFRNLYKDKQLTNNCTDEPLDLTVTTAKPLLNPRPDSAECSKKLPNLNIFEMHNEKERINNNLSSFMITTPTIYANKTKTQPTTAKAISYIESPASKTKMLAEFNRNTLLWKPKSIPYDSIKIKCPRKPSNDIQSAQKVFNLQKELKMKAQTENMEKSGAKIINRNPFRLQINNETPETPTDDSNSKSSSNIRNMNDDVMKYVLKQKCISQVDDSCDWESLESLVLSDVQEEPILTAEQYKLLFQ